MDRRMSNLRFAAVVVIAALVLTPVLAVAAPKPGKPALITSAGQSTDGLILKQL